MVLIHPQMDSMSSLPNDILPIPGPSEPVPLTDLGNDEQVDLGAHTFPELSMPRRCLAMSEWFILLHIRTGLS
jgi:hypothetical protein